MAKAAHNQLPVAPKYPDQPWLKKMPVEFRIDYKEHKAAEISKAIPGLANILGQYFPELITEANAGAITAYAERALADLYARFDIGIQVGMEMQRDKEQAEINRLAQYQINTLGGMG